MVKSRSFRKKVLRACAITGVTLLVVILVTFFGWMYKATRTDIAKQAVEDYGYTNPSLVSKNLTAFSDDDCDETTNPVVFVFQAVNTYTKKKARVVVCASPLKVGKVYVK